MSEIKKPDIYKMNLPADLKKLSTAQCEELCGDIRKILIDTVSKNGGHLASNLGTVELTMAIHRVFESQRDFITSFREINERSPLMNCTGLSKKSAVRYRAFTPSQFFTLLSLHKLSSSCPCPTSTA